MPHVDIVSRVSHLIDKDMVIKSISKMKNEGKAAGRRNCKGSKRTRGCHDH